MVDITQKPYFSYNDIIDTLSAPIQNYADVQLLWFGRHYENGERFVISRHRKFVLDYYTVKKLYEYGVFEKKTLQDLPIGYHMWDHLPYAPPEAYGYAKEIGIAHGLTIIEKNDEYSDFFLFATRPENHQVNNFYLNQKELFSAFIHEFYRTMVDTLEDLSTHTFIVPCVSKLITPPIMTLSPRQRECAILLAAGDHTKDIARKLFVSPRTVEYHIDALREKFQVNNRIQLVHSLKNIL